MRLSSHLGGPPHWIVSCFHQYANGQRLLDGGGGVTKSIPKITFLQFRNDFIELQSGA